jgi:ribosomal protein L34E
VRILPPPNLGTVFNPRTAMSSKQPKSTQMALDQLWTQHQRRINKSSQSWACPNCVERSIFTNTDTLWEHCLQRHPEKIPQDDSERRRYRTRFEAEALSKRNAESPSKRLVVKSSKQRVHQATVASCNFLSPIHQISRIILLGFQAD